MSRRVPSCSAALRQAGGLGLLLGVVAGADQRAALDVAEAHGEGFVLEEGELVRRVEALHDEVVAAGAEILADGEDVDFAVGEVAEDGEQLVHLFAHADDDAGLGDLRLADSRFLGAAEELERAGRSGRRILRCRRGAGTVSML